MRLAMVSGALLLAAAMREDALGELWPPVKTRKEMKQHYYEYMYGKQDISKK